MLNISRLNQIVMKDPKEIITKKIVKILVIQTGLVVAKAIGADVKYSDILGISKEVGDESVDEMNQRYRDFLKY